MKHEIFVNENMGQKDVTELAGIGQELGENLKTRDMEKHIKC